MSESPKTRTPTPWDNLPLDQELFRRECKIEDPSGQVESLFVTFYAPEQCHAGPSSGTYAARARFVCSFFESQIYSVGEDAPQCFFLLNKPATAYLKGRRRYGYEVWWLEKGDLDMRDFWTYSP